MINVESIVFTSTDPVLAPPCEPRFFIGPVEMQLLDGEASATGPAESGGVRTLGIKASLPRPQADELLRLIANPARAITIGGATGVLEPAWFDYGPWAAHNGLYLWTSAEPSSEFVQDQAGIRSVNLSGALIGRPPMVVFSSAIVKNSLGVVGQSVMVVPFWAESSQYFSPTPGPYSFSREYDDTTLVDVGALSEPL